MKRLFTVAALFGCVAIVAACAGAGCDPSGLAPGLTGEGLNQPGDGSPSIFVSPAEQDVADDEDAILVAETANLPEAGADADGIHGAAKLRWTITKGGGGFKPVSTSGPAAQAAPTIDTVPDGQFGNVAVYVPVLGSSGTVEIRVEVIRPTDRTVINEFGEASQELEDLVLTSADAVIHINDLLRLELTPPFTKLPSGGVVELKAVFKAEEDDLAGPDDAEGAGEEPADEPSDIHYEWKMTGLAGAGDLQSQADSDTAVFTAFTEAATFTISVKTTETLADGTELVNGPAYAVVQVDPSLRTVNTFSYYLARDESTDADYYNIFAWVYIPKIQGALSYSVVGQDMHDDEYYSEGWSWSFSRNVTTDVFSGNLEESGGAYRFGLSSAGGSIASGGLAGAYGWMDARFSGMRVLVTAVVGD